MKGGRREGEGPGPKRKEEIRAQTCLYIYARGKIVILLAKYRDHFYNLCTGIIIVIWDTGLVFSRATLQAIATCSVSPYYRSAVRRLYGVSGCERSLKTENIFFTTLPYLAKCQSFSWGKMLSCDEYLAYSALYT